MAELQVLFHNPESLTDDDLSSIRNKVRIHHAVQFGTGLGGFFVAIQYTRRNVYLAPSFLASYFVGDHVARLVNNSTPWSLSQEHDPVIMNAFETKFLRNTQNASGYGNNSLNAANHNNMPNARYKKPY